MSSNPSSDGRFPGIRQGPSQMGDDFGLEQLEWLEFTVYLVAFILVTSHLVFSNAFIPLKRQTMIRTAKETEQAGNGPSSGLEKMEETFLASSTGEGMELINMVQQEDSQRMKNSAVKNLLLYLALSLNAGIMILFF